MKRNVFFLAFLSIVLGLLGAGPAAADILYDVNVNTSSINGTPGNLDFTFAGGLPDPPFGTVTIYNFVSDGTLGAGQLTGDASGSLASTVLINNTPGYNDYFTPFTYGNLLSFSFSFSGPAVTAPDGVSGSSSFAFSLLDNGDPNLNPVLVTLPLPAENPGGFAFMVDLNNDGSTTVNNFMTTGTVAVVPEPLSSILFIAGGAILTFRRFRTN